MAEGHRGRVRTRFHEENIDTIPDYEVLELMLQGILPRVDTRELARTLIREFGGLPQVVDAPMHELLKIPGMGDASASFLKFIPLFYRRYTIDKWEKSVTFNGITQAAEYLYQRFIGYEDEALITLCLNANCKLLACRPVFVGSASAIDINVKKVLQFALTFNASRVIIGHNHLDGSAFPSSEDLLATQRIYDALSFVNIRLDDHIIVHQDDYVSLAQSGYLPHDNSNGKIDVKVNKIRNK